uniref:Uncharacterized protein n=1 Tax=Strigamia maritima TaxID=126957 RepID=T1IMK3_STRMM
MQKDRCPASIETMERCRFDHRTQAPDESISDYIAALYKMSTKCNFDDQLAIRLRDRFVSGQKSQQIQRMLFNTKDLNFEVARTAALAMELAAKEVASLHGQPNPAISTHFVQHNAHRKTRKPDHTTLTMSSYQGHVSQLDGICEVPVKYAGRSYSLPLCVVADGALPLLGRDWLQACGLLDRIEQLFGAPRTKATAFDTKLAAVGSSTSPTLEQVLAKHADIFRDEIGRSKSVKVHIDLDPAVKEIFIKATTPHSTTHRTPADEFYRRTLRSRLHLLNPRLLHQSAVLQTAREFEVGDLVFARDYRSAVRWVPGVVLARKSSTTYTIEVSNAVQWSRHIDQLRPRTSLQASSTQKGEEMITSLDDWIPVVSAPATIIQPIIPAVPTPALPPSSSVATPSVQPSSVHLPSSPPPANRNLVSQRANPRPRRNVKPPAFYGFDST